MKLSIKMAPNEIKTIFLYIIRFKVVLLMIFYNLKKNNAYTSVTLEMNSGHPSNKGEIAQTTLKYAPL